MTKEDGLRALASPSSVLLFPTMKQDVEGKGSLHSPRTLCGCLVLDIPL